MKLPIPSEKTDETKTIASSVGMLFVLSVWMLFHSAFVEANAYMVVAMAVGGVLVVLQYVRKISSAILGKTIEILSRIYFRFAPAVLRMDSDSSRFFANINSSKSRNYEQTLFRRVRLLQFNDGLAIYRRKQLHSASPSFEISAI